MTTRVEDDKIGPGVELRDPVRLQLLKNLQDIVGQVPQKAQATFLLCDIQYLQELCESFVNRVAFDTFQQAFSSSRVDEIVTKWCQLSRQRSTPSISQSIPLSEQAAEAQTSNQKRKRSDTQSSVYRQRRLKNVSDECKNRDSHRCVITKLAGPIDAAHIIPFSLNQQDRRASFFNLLKVLWSQRIEKWETMLCNGTEFLENMISFTPTLHRCHSAGLFGLQPIEASSDRKSLKLKFYWLPKRESLGNTMTDITDIPTLPDDVELEDMKIFNGRDGHRIKSGEVIELTTLDPERWPLPNWELLEMQWVLQRLTALRGAAGLPDMVFHDEFESSSSLECSDYGMKNRNLFAMNLDHYVPDEKSDMNSSINKWLDAQAAAQQIEF
ncbi:hypothetical protein LOZ12_005562 [Ophidiomyces ophidiicola]|uniref:Uncharacterized protein n=1 Tax=Ophidiomyces ophidiicola TaxID=1387563 RepID=A0ACB8UT52_9EURO|nr:uncharacterized protein LOZ57_002680 [Ophidiomyces ophidiicola]KAI1907305.1 hypothetical protein LOZ61_006226 [Ophidiomyces ophidiicola]KAI1911523.1 hypothetical protein LOZ64_004717 [Ophidiomyces ophidiicola]KAI1922274.1 hypothetical protein LOZ60_005804 [Ophidiomyces ophidiicola]KAI1945910.1 hypothetical protein LOZ62_003634 [Ophidiomyces ophidiicola]KAI1948329.1 hypothetical protein LOZ57_002680 [Ophidiomyces ophidiicola]